MLRFNTFRADRYLRSKFVEGKFLLASEAGDLQLEALDLMRQTVKTSIGDVFVGDAWKVSKVANDQLLVAPGEAWFKGLPFSMRSGKDQLVSGSSLSPGIIPASVVMTDDPNGLGKLITFNSGGTTPTNDYRIVVTAREELITSNEDAFLQNANLTENTAQKVRLQFTIDIVPVSAQSSTPVPYTNDTTDQNLTNEIEITPAAALNGELITSTQVPGAEQIDGRDLELTIRNNPALGGGNPIPNGSTDQQAFFNGKLIDSNGTEFHINAIFNDVVSTQVKIRIDKEVGQQDPEIINGKSYKLIKRDVFVTDDANGNPLGKLFLPIADVDWNSVDGFVHQSSVADLRNVVVSDSDFQDITNQKFNLILTEGGKLSFIDTSLATASGTITIVDNNFEAGDGVSVDGTNFIIDVDFVAGATASDTATNLATAIDALGSVSASAIGAVITVTAASSGSAGNSIALDKINSGEANFELSGDSLEGGADDSPGLFAWTQAFTLINPHGNSMTIPANSLSVLEGGSVAYTLDESGGVIEIGNLAVNITASGTTLTLDPVDLSTVKVGNVISIEDEYQEITAVDNENNTVTVASAISATGAAIIHRDSFAAGKVPLDENSFVLAVRKSNKLYLNGQMELENGESADLGDINDAILDAIGLLDENGKPIYQSLKVVKQGSPLTEAISDLDSEVGLLATLPGQINQDRNLKLIEGGTWDWDLTTDTLSYSADAQIQIPGITDDRNNIVAGSIVLASDGDVATVEINRQPGVAANLTITVSAIDSVTLTKDTAIVARRVGDEVIVGNSIKLIDNESASLYATTSDQNLTYMGASSTSDTDPEYTTVSAGSLNSPNFNTTNGEGLTTRLSKITAMLADLKQDINIEFDAGDITWDGTNITVSNASLSIPGTTVGADEVTINDIGSTALADNSALYVDISRTVGTALTLSSATLSSLTPSQQRLVLIRNINGNLSVR